MKYQLLCRLVQKINNQHDTQTKQILSIHMMCENETPMFEYGHSMKIINEPLTKHQNRYILKNLQLKKQNKKPPILSNCKKGRNPFLADEESFCQVRAAKLQLSEASPS